MTSASPGDVGHGPTARDGAPPRRRWRVLLDGPGDAYWNMAVDAAVHDAVEAGMVAPTARFYRWERPSVSVGRHQNVPSTVRVDFCATRSIPLVRRPTGGRGILHGGDQTVSLAMPLTALPAEASGVAGSYAALGAGFRAAFRTLGVDLASGDERRPAPGIGDCFALRTPADLLTQGGQKLVGSAQHRGRTSVLQQSSVLHLPTTVDSTAVFLGRPATAGFPLEHLDHDELVAALIDGLAAALAASFVEDTLTQWEVERAAVVAASLKSQCG